jgi:SAF domain
VSSQPPGVGTAYFPDTDIMSNGSGPSPAPGPEAGRLRSLPRRRRPAMIALALALAGAGVIVSAAVYQRADHQVAVIMVTQAVPAGAVITSADVGTTNITVGVGLKVIPAAQAGQVSGEVAAVALRPGTLLAPADLTTAQPPGPGQELVPASVKPSTLPASGLFPGDQVLIVATPGDQGQPGSATGAQPLTSPVPAVVAAVNDVPDSAGVDVVDLLVSDAEGPAVAAQVSTGQFAIVVTKRGS